MNQLREEDPERHQRILERLQKSNEQTAQALADSVEFLFNLDMALMTPEQVLNHQHLLGLIEASWTQLDRMQENPQGPFPLGTLPACPSLWFPPMPGARFT